MEHRFDELAKALALGQTRRQALRRIGGSLSGALLASLGLGKVWGAPPITTCPGYCRSIGIDPGHGNAFGKCVSNCSNCVNTGGRACGPDP
jgi:hypothetical protein